MKFSIRAALAGAALTAAGIGLASPASAVISTVGDSDDYSGYNYAVELHLAGMTGTVAQAVSLAETVCSARMAGRSEDQLIWAEMSPPAPYFTSEQAVTIVMGGEYHFCSAYEDDGSGGRAPSVPAPAAPTSPGPGTEI